MGEPKPPSSTEKLHEAYHADGADAVSRVYDEWASDYETHMREVGYTHPAMVAAMVGRHVPPGDAPVLDAGAGTGVMGEILTGLGFGHVVALDASPGMLESARAKGRYRDLHHAFLGEPLGFPDDAFAAVVSAGVFTQGHAPLDGLDELVRVTRPGGRLAFSVARTYLEGPFDAKREALEHAGAWRFVDASEPYNSAPLQDTLISRVFVYEAA